MAGDGDQFLFSWTLWRVVEWSCHGKETGHYYYNKWGGVWMVTNGIAPPGDEKIIREKSVAWAIYLVMITQSLCGMQHCVLDGILEDH